jgi:hypothetical protein
MFSIELLISSRITGFVEYKYNAFREYSFVEIFDKINGMNNGG